MRKELGLFSNHALILLAVLGNDHPTLTDLANRSGLSTRTITQILRDLEACGVVITEKTGRRNSYALDWAAVFAIPVNDGMKVADWIGLLEDHLPARKLSGVRA